MTKKTNYSINGLTILKKTVSKIDGFTDPVTISEHLKGIYEKLYNRTGTSEPLENLYDEIDTKVTEDDFVYVDKVTPELT